MIGLSTYGLTNMTFKIVFKDLSFKKKLIVIKLEIKGNSRFQTKEGKKKKDLIFMIKQDMKMHAAEGR